jgi:hypothetical protein
MPQSRAVLPLVLLAACGLVLTAGLAKAQEEGADKVRPELLARKNYLVMAVKVNAPPEALKEAKLSKETIQTTAERLIKAQGIEVVKADNERQDMALVITIGMKPDGTGSCELNVIVVDENKATGDKKAAMAYDSFTTHQGRTPRDLGGQLMKALTKDVGAFCATHKKHNAK